MNLTLVLAILVTGLSGIVAQVLLLRELLISFLGNELTLGIILAGWLISEALGVFIIGKIIDRVRNKIDIFVILQLLFSLTLPLSIYLSRTFKSLFGILPGEAIGLLPIFYASFLIILLPGFCHAALFSCGCKIYSLSEKQAVRSIGRIYALEITGTVIGGLVLTYALLPRLNSFQIAFIVSVANFFTAFAFLRYSSGRILKYITLALIGLVIYLSANGSIANIQRLSVERQFKPAEVLAYDNSLYGNVAVIKQEGQYTFFYNGVPAVTVPFPDITFVEEFGNLPLLFQQSPKDVLIISGGAGGLINEILKYPVEKIDYVELDPLIIDMLNKFPSDLIKRELNDKKTNVINTDGRLFIRSTPDRYDLILVGLSTPRDLSTNRLFTSEFFSLIKKRLNPKGILAFCLPGSLTYLSRELRDINACILNALDSNYGHIRIIPGDYNIFLASESKEIMEVTPALITQRIKLFNIKTKFLAAPGYLDYRLNKKWTDWFERSLSGATKKINLDTAPYAVFQMLVLWNKQYSYAISAGLNYLSNLRLWDILIPALIMTSALFYIFYRKAGRLAKKAIAYSILTTGFSGMLMSLVLIFVFQVYYGYIYHIIGVLISLFMAGCVSGSIFITHYDKAGKNHFNLFVRLEILIIIFSCITAIIINNFPENAHYSSLVVFILSFALGALVGMEFPLAGRIYLPRKEQIGETVGLLYFSDLLGGCIAGVLGGVLLLPVLGLFNACLVIIIFKSSSLFLLLPLKKTM